MENPNLNPKNDPLEQGVFAIPDLSGNGAHETIIIEKLAVVLTGAFVGKILPYAGPQPGTSHYSFYTTLIADIFVVVAIAVEMAQPSSNPSDFQECFDAANKRVEECLSNLPPDSKKSVEENLLELQKLSQLADIAVAFGKSFRQ